MNKRILFTLLLVSFPAVYAIAAPTPFAGIMDAQKIQIQKMVKKIMPELVVEEVASSPLSGVYQVTANGQIFYTAENGRYLFHGDLLDLTKEKNKVNLTEEVRKKSRLKALETMQKKDMIVFSPITEAKGVITVFTDLDCIYCQKFHQEINKITELGIDVQYLAFPRQGLGSDSFKKSVSVWCAEDPKAMFTAAKNGEAVPSKTCESPVAKEFELGRKLLVQGTPTIIFADGTMLAGFMQPEELVKLALEHKLPSITVTK